MDNQNQFADQITTSCFQTYKSLGKKGKPELGREWTKMACFVKTDVNDVIDVVTLATGTKCIGENQRTNQGTLLNDSHAEILARRLFLKYLYNQLMVFNDEPVKSIWNKCSETGLYFLKNGIKFHLFSTDAPCGDASIFMWDKTCKDQENSRTAQENGKRKLSTDSFFSEKGYDCKRICTNTCRELDSTGVCSKDGFRDSKEKSINYTSSKSSADENCCKISADIHRTGAKCVPSGRQDLLEPGTNYHVTGALRVKPGRGDRTLSMSCSDKMMKWCALGLQGGLLLNFLKNPIFLSSFIVSKVEFDYDAMYRALNLRDRTSNNTLKAHVPEIFQSVITFVHSKESVEEKSDRTKCGRITPAGAAILWCPSCNIHEVSANGIKHGIIKKDSNTAKAKTSICKDSLFTDFKTLMKTLVMEDRLIGLSTYSQYKHASQQYRETRLGFFDIFPDWTKKPKEHEDFT